jgi:plasmid stabilization system protein ParE
MARSLLSWRVRFYREIERLIREVCAHPGLFAGLIRRRVGISVPYAVIYFETPAQVWIVAIMHMKRQPGYWRERLV